MTDQTLTSDASNVKNGKTPEKKATGWAERASAKLNKTRKPIAEKLRGTAEAIQDQAQSLYENERISERTSDVAYDAAERVETSAAYVESHEIGEMARDAVGLVSRNPIAAMAVAAAAGFLIGRAIARR
jgi:ElaB/YqjD/DUF883 family membrane-anchored ribosome-binding protein